MPKLTEEAVVAIVLDPRGVEDVARAYDIDKSMVSRIRNGLRHSSATEAVRKRLERKQHLLDEMEKLVDKALGLIEDEIAEQRKDTDR